MVRRILLVALCFVVAVVQAASPKELSDAITLLAIQQDATSPRALAVYTSWDAAGSAVKIKQYAAVQKDLIKSAEKFKEGSRRKKAIRVLLDALDKEYRVAQESLAADRKMAEDLARGLPTPRDHRGMARRPVHAGPVRAVHIPGLRPKSSSRSSSRSSSPSFEKGSSDAAAGGMPRPRSGLKRSSSASRLTPRTLAAIEASFLPSPRTQEAIHAAAHGDGGELLGAAPSVAAAGGMPRPRSGLKRSSSASRLTPRTHPGIDASHLTSPRTQKAIHAALYGEEPELLGAAPSGMTPTPRRPHRVPPLGSGAGSPQERSLGSARSRSTPRLGVQEFEVYKAPDQRRFKARYGGDVWGLGFHCGRQRRATCGWNSMSNAVSLINASNNPGDMLANLSRCRFWTNDEVRRKKALFEAVAGQRYGEWTSGSEINDFFNYLVAEHGGCGDRTLFLPDFRFGLELDDTAIVNAVVALTRLRSAGCSPDEIVTGVNKAMAGEGYTVGSVSLSRRDVDDIRSFAHRLQPVIPIVDALDAGKLVIWVDYWESHWTCRCVFIQGGRVYFGDANSLSPGSISLNNRAQQILRLVLNPPFSKKHLSLMRQIFPDLNWQG